MKDLTPYLIELIRLASTSLPADVEEALIAAHEQEENQSPAKSALSAILENTALARDGAVPLCQDTGTPIFQVCYPSGYSISEIKRQIRAAVAGATAQSLLRPNAVHGLTQINSGDNLGGEHFPSLHFKEAEAGDLVIDLILKGGGCENVGRQYSLPDESLGAGRDLDGVRKAALDAVFHAQGRGCAPEFLGIAVGGDRGTSYMVSKEVFFDPVNIRHPDPEISAMEERITREANQLGIGPMGFGGRTTVLATRIVGAHRLPASFFVSVSFMCWAFRRARLSISAGKASFNNYG